MLDILKTFLISIGLIASTTVTNVPTQPVNLGAATRTIVHSLDFKGELLPDGDTCSNNQILKKTGTNDWDCAADATGAGGTTTTINGVDGPDFTLSLTSSTASGVYNITSTTSTGSITFNIEIPSNVGFFTNDSGYLTTSTGLTIANFATSSISQWNNDAGYVTSTSGGGLASTSPFTVADLVVVSSSGALSTISSSTYYLASNPAGYLTTSSASATITSAGFTWTTPFTFGTSTGISITSSSGNIIFGNTGVTSIATTSPINADVGVGGVTLSITTTTFLMKADNLAGLGSTSTSRTNLGLGSIATFASTDYLTSSTAFVSSINGTSGAYNIYAGGLLTRTTGTASTTISFASSSLGLGNLSVINSPLPVANGGTANTAFTAGSVVFASSTTLLGEDNTGLFYDNTNNFLGLGTAVPSSSLHVVGSSTLPNILGTMSETASSTNLHLWPFATGTIVGITTGMADQAGSTPGRIILNGAVKIKNVKVLGGNVFGGMITYDDSYHVPAGLNQFGMVRFNGTVYIDAQQTLSNFPTFDGQPTYVSSSTTDVASALSVFHAKPNWAPTATGTIMSTHSGVMSRPRVLPVGVTTTVSVVSAYDTFWDDVITDDFNSSATIPIMAHYYARQPNATGFNVSQLSGITTQCIFCAQPMQGGTNGYGLWLQNIASGTSRFNIRISGAAGNSILGNTVVGTTTYPAGIGNLEVLANTSSTLAVGDATHPGCIVIGDTDAGGVTYVTALNGVLTAATAKPVYCK